MNLLGNLLIAPPAVKNNFWHQSTILVTEHNTQGSIGLIINKRSDLSIRDFGSQLGFQLNYPGHVYIGGPVNVKSLSFLHTPEWESTNTMHLSSELSISSAEDILPRMSIGDVPYKWRIFLGMAGWAPGQLNGEILGNPPWTKANSWCIATTDVDLIFDTDGKDQWCNCLDKSGLEFAQSMLA